MNKPLYRAPAFLKLLFSPLYFVFTFVFIETVFHIAEFRDAQLVFPILFAVPAGVLFGIICDLFPEKVARVFRYVLSAAVMVIFGTQIVYFHSFRSFMSMGQVGMGGAVFTNFFSTIMYAIWECLPLLLLIFSPLLLLFFGERYCRPNNKFDWQISLVLLAFFAATQLLAVFALPASGTGTHSAYGIYHSGDLILDLSVEKLGLLTSTRSDVGMLLFGGPDDPTVDPDVPIIVARPDDGTKGPETTGPSSGPENTGDGSGTDITPPAPPEPSDNIIEGLDFAALATAETDKTAKLVFKYLAALEPTAKNKYTGMFEGYNLILICAESFSTAAIDPELTPTLYRLSTEGFIFKNYYTMYPSNTTNGEYSFLTGLVPDLTKPKSDGSFVASAKNTMDRGIGAYFNRLGLTTRAYHDHTRTYYSRNVTHPNLGYIFKGREDIGGLSGWPESDLVMMQRTIPEYINDELFHTYYMTVSGHHNYRFGGLNSIADKNRELVGDLPYGEAGRAYLACSIELDRALEYLIGELQKAGKLEKTVICLAPDHYPYGMTDQEHREVHGTKAAYGGLDRYHTTLLLWNSEMEPVTVEKPCCQVDVLPTLLNLFGFEYDSRLYSGTDILSDSFGLAMTSNQSFITDKIVYNSRYETVYYLDKSWTMPDGYLDAYIQIVKNRFSIASNILNLDLYSKLPK